MDFSDDQLDEIASGLFLCDYKKAARRSLLSKYQITHVLMMCGGVSPPYPSDYIYKLECIDDQTTSLQGVIETTNLCVLTRFIDQALTSGGKVVVHCILGASRSAATVTAYLMWKQRLRFRDALALVQRKHRDTDLHLFLRQQLKDYECALVICRQFPDHADCVFRCVNCQALVFDWSDVVVHSYESKENPCTRYFLRHSEWVKDWSDFGDVTCYRCKQRLGHFDHDTGIVCACGELMNPGYLIDQNA